MGNVIRLGDTSSHGGSMISASTTVIVEGSPMCISGDSHACPIRGHGVTSVTGSSSVSGSGSSVIKDGDTAGCGAILSSGAQTTTFG